MRSAMLSLLLAAQLTLPAPGLAAGAGHGEQAEFGAFGGVQVRVPLGGARAEAPKLSLGLAPAARSRRFDGAGQTRIGEGLQLSLQPNRPAELSLAGTRVDRLGLSPSGPTREGPRAGISTLGWVGIGVGVLVVAAGGFAIWLDEAMECDPGEC